MIQPESKDIKGWFHYRNLYTNMIRKAEPGARFVEIGAWQGKSTFFMAASIANSKKDIKFWTIDTWKGSKEHEDLDIIKEDKLYDIFLHNIQPVRDYVVPIRGNSSEQADRFEDGSLDFVLVDGDHSLEGATKDIEAFWPKVKDGGIMAGDDLGWKGVRMAVYGHFPYVFSWAENKSKSVMWMVRKGEMKDEWIYNPLG